MSVEITWIHHASFRLASGEAVVYIDPWKLPPAPHDADAVFVSHSHYDHFSVEDIRRVAKPDTTVIGPDDVVRQYGSGKPLLPGHGITVKAVSFQAVPAYNIDKPYHPKANNWIGVVIHIGDIKAYYAGDTDRVPEMSHLKDIDIAFLPVGGTYTLDAQQAARACQAIRCRSVIPYHWGDIVGQLSDATRFAEAVKCCKVHLLRPGQKVRIESPLETGQAGLLGK